MRQNFKDQSGFSAVEITIVVVIAGILLAIAIPITISHLQAHRLDTGVAVVSQKVMEARMSAIKRNRTSSIVVSLANKTAQIRSTDSSNNLVNIGLETRFPPDIGLNAEADFTLSFDSMGRLSGGAQTLVLKDGLSNSTKSVTISPSGHVSVGPMIQITVASAL